jgi:hypothetical protein
MVDIRSLLIFMTSRIVGGKAMLKKSTLMSGAGGDNNEDGEAYHTSKASSKNCNI